VRKVLAESILNAAGWSVLNEVPPETHKFVLIGAPHTSNWDFILTLLVAGVLDLDFAWVGKDSLFRWPYGELMRRLGGVSVDRTKAHGYVDQLAEKLERADRMALVIAPEGTRSKSDRWRSGFYWIAREADVPIVMGFVDYSRREAGLGPTIESVATKDKKAVMDRLREFYADKKGLYPENLTPPTLDAQDGTEGN
jgi:1-acyl-sn-glycerol-3-phosphate acyltransferase